METSFDKVLAIEQSLKRMLKVRENNSMPILGVSRIELFIDDCPNWIVIEHQFEESKKLCSTSVVDTESSLKILIRFNQVPMDIINRPKDVLFILDEIRNWLVTDKSLKMPDMSLVLLDWGNETTTTFRNRKGVPCVQLSFGNSSSVNQAFRLSPDGLTAYLNDEVHILNKRESAVISHLYEKHKQGWPNVDKQTLIDIGCGEKSEVCEVRLIFSDRKIHRALVKYAGKGMYRLNI